MAQNELFHIGVKRRSGRYPYGSGERPYQDRERKAVRVGRERLENRISKANETLSDEKKLTKFGKKTIRERRATIAGIVVGNIGMGAVSAMIAGAGAPVLGIAISATTLAGSAAKGYSYLKKTLY